MLIIEQMARNHAGAAALAAFGSLVTLALFLTLAGGPQPGARQPATAPARAVVIGHGQPLAFEPNAGRFGRGLDYVVRDHGTTLGIRAGHSVLAVGDGGALHTQLVGASTAAQPHRARRLPGVVNWYVGADRTNWRRGLPTFDGVSYARIYPGIDVSYHGRQGQLEYDFILAPHARASRINLALRGAKSLRVAANGNLVARVGSRTITQLRPVAYQRIGGAKQVVRANFVLGGNRVSFKLGSYDHTRPLVIDPVLSYSDYIGSTGDDAGYAVAADAAGNAYVGGISTSPSLPGAPQGRPGADTGFVMKVAPGGARSWITYVGYDVKGVALDGAGNVLIGGSTSGGLAVKNAAQPNFGGGMTDGFAAALAPDGSTKWVTYLGGTTHDTATSIAADRAGDAYVGVITNSVGLATVGAFQTLVNGNGGTNGPDDALVAKYSPTGTKVFVTYIGGSSTDNAQGIGVAPTCNSSCDVFIGGSTTSSDFPKSVAGSLGGSGDAFIFRLAASGSTRVWGAYDGDTDFEDAHGLAVSDAGNPALVGVTGSASKAGQTFVHTFNATTAARTVGPQSEFGAAGDDTGRAIAFDAQGNAYVTGSTTSSSGFDVTGAVQPNFGGQQDAFAVKVKADGTVFPVWSTYLGGFNFETGYGIATDESGGAFVVGSTSSNDFPLVASTQGNSTPSDGFIAKIQVRPVTVTGPSGTLRSHTAAFTYTSGEPGGSFKCRLTPVESDFFPCPNSGRTYSSLPDGSYTFEIAAVDPGSTPGPLTQRPFEVDTRPIAAFAIAPNPVLAGRTAVFDGTASSGADQPIVKYEWDLNGDGVFERNTGTAATTSQSFGLPQTTPVSLRVTDAGGLTATATADLRVTANPSASQLGVTINNGAQFTRTPNVTVTANFPAATTSMLFSNDGGFLKPSTFPPDKTTKWKLDSSGPERLPKTIYVRFLNGPIVSETHQDDIILDEIPPKVQEAVVTSDAPAASGAASAARLRSWKVKVKAKDSNSGVSRVQVTSNKRKPGKALKYKRRLTVKSAKRPRWLRARDRAGNWSKWKRATRR